MKPSYVHIETLDERGRYISYDEFKWIINYFRDRYDPRRLSFALSYTTGLRHEDSVKVRIKWFDPEFKFMKMSQNKPHVRKKDGVIQITSKPKFVPLPDWLSEDLLSYVKYRLLIGQYIGNGNGIEEGRLFPSLKKHQLRNLFSKLRLRYGDKEKWLNDIWKVITAYDKDGKVLWKRNWYRIACHAGRANYCTAAYIVSDKDLAKTKVLTGHDETKDVERYVRVSGIMESKMVIKEQFMDTLASKQSTPLLKGQKRLIDFYKENK